MKLFLLALLTAGVIAGDRMPRMPLWSAHDCQWASRVLKLDRNLDAGTAADRGTNAHYYKQMADAWGVALNQADAVCRERQPLTAAECSPTMDALVEATGSHQWFIENPEGVSAFDMSFHVAWRNTYLKLTRLFVQACPSLQALTR